MKFLHYCFFVLLLSSQIYAQKVAVFDKYDVLEKTVLNDKNTIYVVNFWATWCAPCVKELPFFEKLNTENKNVKVVLISLDFKDQFETKLVPFLKRKSIHSKVVLLTDKDYNNWLPKVDKEWSGSIPATLIIKNGKRVFAERIFSDYAELNEYVTNSIN